jgi:hypothetical protein
MPRRVDVWNAAHAITGAGLSAGQYYYTAKAAEPILKKIKEKVVGKHQPQSKMVVGNKRLPLNDPSFNVSKSSAGNKIRGSGRSRAANKKGGVSDPYRDVNLVFKQTKVPGGRYTFTGLIELANNAAGRSSNYLYIGYGTAQASELLSYLSGDANKLLQVFTNHDIHSITLRFVGTGASTTTGYFALGMDANTSLGSAPLTLGDITGSGSASSDSVNVVDVKGEMSMTFRPKVGQTSHCKANDSAADNADKYAGSIRYLSINNLAISAQTGLLHLAVDMTLNL